MLLYLKLTKNFGVMHIQGSINAQNRLMDANNPAVQRNMTECSRKTDGLAFNAVLGNCTLSV